MSPFPYRRMRRLRSTTRMRQWVAETHLTRHSLVKPLFVCEGEGVERPITSLPGQFQLSVDQVSAVARKIQDSGVPAVLLFGIPDSKDPSGTFSTDPEGVVPRAVRAIRESAEDLIVIGDVCLCEFTDHGHCGIVSASPGGQPLIDNDATLEVLATQSRVLADAGCQVVAPSAMMDGQVRAIRGTLDGAAHGQVVILSYAAKFASSFYGPFREAVKSAPSLGDRKTYQMDCRNIREAIEEVSLDIEEGADIVMVKPGLPYLDVITKIRQNFNVPVAAYHVSGEWSMLRAAAERGWIDGDSVYLESLRCLHRSGADIIITYGAEEAIRLLER